jgi:hypothetical protein
VQELVGFHVVDETADTQLFFTTFLANPGGLGDLYRRYVATQLKATSLRGGEPRITEILEFVDPGPDAATPPPQGS